jgi:BCCT family betaine/carnitine transporter
MNKQKVDWPSFVASVAIILVASISLVLFPESGARFLADLYAFISGHFAFVYLLAGVATLGLLIWLATGRFGKVHLGAEDE